MTTYHVVAKKKEICAKNSKLTLLATTFVVVIGLNDSLLRTKLRMGYFCNHTPIAMTCHHYILPCSSLIATTCRHFPETKLKLLTLPSMRDILVKNTPIVMTCRSYRPIDMPIQCQYSVMIFGTLQL